MFVRLMNQFRQFVLRGGVFEFMVAFAMAGAFASFMRDLVQHLLTPLIALALGQPETEALTVSIRGTVFRYGLLLESFLAFLLIAAAVFAVVVAANQLAMHAHHSNPVDPTLRTCPECLSDIPRRARRCAWCGSEVRAFVTEREPATSTDPRVERYRGLAGTTIPSPGHGASRPLRARTRAEDRACKRRRATPARFPRMQSSAAIRLPLA